MGTDNLASLVSPAFRDRLRPLGASEIAGSYDNETVLLVVSSPPPSSVAASAPFAMSVQLQYGTGAVVTGFNGLVEIRLSSNPGGATLGGMQIVRASDGLAVFTDLSLDDPAAATRLEAYTQFAATSSATSAPVTLEVTTATPSPTPTARGAELGQPGRHHLRHAAVIDPARRFGRRARFFDYSPGPGSILKAGSHTLSVIHAQGHDRLSDRLEDGHDRRRAGDARHHLVAPVGHRLRHGASSAQLDATASVPGTFAYSPASGSMPGVGHETLSVTFTPSDSADYKKVSATVPLTILLAPAPTPTPSPTPAPSPTPTPTSAVVISQQPVFHARPTRRASPSARRRADRLHPRLRRPAQCLGGGCRQLPGRYHHHEEGQEEGRAHPALDPELHGLLQPGE